MKNLSHGTFSARSRAVYNWILFAVIAILLCFNGFCAPAFAENSGEKYVYVGGYPVGISLDVGGLLVESVTGVETEYGIAYVEGLDKGDIITHIGGVSVDDINDISDVLKTDDAVSVKLCRDGQTLEITIKPVAELYTGKPRLGVKIKDKLYGVGTVTFVREDGTFAALGHEIYDSDSGTHIPFAGGHIHACKVIGIKKGEKNERGKKTEAGAILASLVPDKVYGDVCCNNSFGIGGKFTSEFDKTEKYPLGTADDVRPGAAKIRTTVGGSPEYFDVEIIKAVKQTQRKEKGIVIRVTDKRLLDATGGIVRGMSGSPVIQDGKLVAAVTHVFLNDFTKGYGVYAEFLN